MLSLHTRWYVSPCLSRSDLHHSVANTPRSSFGIQIRAPLHATGSLNRTKLSAVGSVDFVLNVKVCLTHDVVSNSVLLPSEGLLSEITPSMTCTADVSMRDGYTYEIRFLPL